MVVKFKKKNRRKPNRKRYSLNNRIRYPTLRVIGDGGDNLGVISTKEALQVAREKDLDLVVISEKANPPVAKILEFSKFLYEDRKKQSAIKSKSKKSETKEFVFGPSIGEGDLEKRIERTKEFLQDGNRVKITVRLRGRQRAHPEIGFEKLDKFIEELEEIAKVEEDPKLRGTLIAVTFVKK